MPEFFNGICQFQPRAQPYLTAIARGVRDEASSRAFLLENTQYALPYAGAKPLWQEQWQKRDPNDGMVCPFWSNYWYNPCSSCNCRIDKSVSMEIDAIFFLQNADRKKLAIHIEMKRDNESFSIGQAEAYKPRAECFRDRRKNRKTLLEHNHFITVLFCGTGTNIPLAKKYFDNVILHKDARNVFPNHPIV